MNQPTHEEIWVWVTQHPDYERAKHVCPQCHADCTGHKKVQALGAPILEPLHGSAATACRYEFGEREAVRDKYGLTLYNIRTGERRKTLEEGWCIDQADLKE